MANENNYKNLEIDIDKIKPDVNQPRKNFDTTGIEKLADNIKEHGLIEPILLTPLNENEYKIIQGERRWRATQLLLDKTKDEKYSKIHATVIETDNPLFPIITSLVRKDLNTMEYADALSELKNSMKESDEEVAKVIGKSRTNVVEWLSLTKLPDEIRQDAKKTDIVPFRELKQLAASLKSDNSNTKEIINRYNELKLKYTSNGEYTDDKSKKRKRSSKEETILNKFKLTTDLMGELKDEDLTNIKDKDALISALDQIMEKATNVKARLQDVKTVSQDISQ